ncbi:hypothetical protein QFZ53_003268 [Microbacterium natoriense]|uniref:Uncharacterized protein n=1 Tax=Microbacterium natoriense TaxID=284570 RepID=A0AAW8F0K1_9MICO|nr:hypothetical protein [Microbacterium natoriense]MDQ0649072.1 hypothetical protein [Microbacterium natoriense]
MKATICGLVLLAAAFVAMLVTNDLGIVPLLLMLVGGWCLGFAFVNLTFRMRRNGLFLHIAGAVVISAEGFAMIEFGGPLLAALPEPVGAALIVVQMAGITAVAWIWLGLLSRVTDALTRRERRNAPTRTTPQWERDEGGDGSFVSVRAIRLRMRQVTVAIVGVVLAVSGFGIALLIAFDDAVSHLGARLSIVLIGIVLGLPAYAALSTVLRRRTEECTIAFGNDEVRLTVGESSSVIRFSDLEHLRWRGGSDYARVELRGRGVDLSLFIGLAKPAPGRTAELPPLPRRVFTRLERVGLVVTRSRRGDVVTFSRTVS